ncbi:hypothetical protein A0256_22725 [Mucilaginibacter sp. PAMC 26640]|nr:hypothetical protein A0256_22725 [Mucilaginibacter sp. PAMC 26640]
MNATLLYQTNALLGEGAIWDHVENKLYWVDIEGCTFNIYDVGRNKNKVYNVQKTVGTVVPVNSNTVLLALEDGLAFLNLTDGTIAYQLSWPLHEENKRFNDGKCDGQGRFWVGSLTKGQGTGSNKLYCVTPNFTITEKLNNLTISNGIAWSVCGNYMYHIDTPTSQVIKYDFDYHTGAISNPQIIIKVPPEDGYPDGMTIDANGKLWIALWDGFCVAQYNPETGQLLQKVMVPAPKVTSCAFGGEKLDKLFITTASCEMTSEELAQYPLSGSLFVADTGVTGVRSNFFGLDDISA